MSLILDHCLKDRNEAEVKPLGNASLMTTSKPLAIEKRPAQACTIYMSVGPHKCERFPLMVESVPK
jgi:hypothetical protein